MSIFKRGKIYWYHFVFNGEHIQQSTKQSNPRVARQMEAAHRTALAKGEVGLVERKVAPVFSTFAEEFLTLIQAQRSPRTYRRYKVSLVSLRRWFEDKRLNEITTELINAYKLARLEQGRTKATANRDLACLRRMLRLAMKCGKVTRSPFSEGGVEFLQEQGRERILSFEEECRYLLAANSTLRDVAILMAETGMRPEEVFTIRQENVHLPERFIYVPAGKTKNAKRDVFLTDASYEALKRRLTAAKGPFLFPRRLGHQKYDWNRPMTQIWNAHHEALAKSGITPSFKLYDLRHTYGTRAAESGVDPLTLMKLMGHANVQTTNRYVHLSKRHLAEAQKKLEAYRIDRMLAEAGQEPRRPM